MEIDWVVATRVGERVVLTMAFLGILLALLRWYRFWPDEPSVSPPASGGSDGQTASAPRARDLQRVVVDLKQGTFSMELVIPVTLVGLFIGYAYVALSNPVERTVAAADGATVGTLMFDPPRAGGMTEPEIRRLFDAVARRESGLEEVQYARALAALDLVWDADRLIRAGNLAIDDLLADRTLTLVELQQRIDALTAAELPDGP